MQSFFRKAANRFFLWQSDETIILSAIALIVGALTGIGVWLYKGLIIIVHSFAFGTMGGFLQTLSPWLIFLLPIAGGLVVGLLVHILVGEERHHGVSGIMEAVALAGGRLRYWRVPFKAVASAVSIGSGASVGPEDPSVQIGANLGSMIGQWVNLSDNRMKAVVGAGAGAGIAAAFNAPIAGVFFALEVILGEIGGDSLGIIVIASVASAVFTQAISGPQPAFKIPAYAFQSLRELPLYLGLGLLAGPVAALYVRALYIAQDLFHGLHTPRWVKPALAGVAVGGVGLFLPQVFGVGYDSIEVVLTDGKMLTWMLFTLLIAKLVMTSVSIGGGFVGGVFAPSLFLGAMLGAGYGNVVASLFPGLSILPPAFAMVGMAAVLAGSVHAPLTAVLLLFEMTNDYRIILPLMFAVAVSLLISQRLIGDSVYTLGLARKGIRLERGRDVDVLSAITVGEVMHTNPLKLHASDKIMQAADLFLHTRRHGLPVVDDNNNLVGVFTLSDLDRAQQEGKEDETVGENSTHNPIVAYPDETIGEALRLMSSGNIGRLPVVSPQDPRNLVGMLRRDDVIRAYDLALTKRAALRQRAQEVRLGAMSGEDTRVIELQVEPGAECDGKRIKEIEWPQNAVVATLRRGRHFMIPHGDTTLRSGDVLIAVAEGDARQQLEHICQVDSSPP